MFEGDNIKKAAILRDFLNFRTWQRQNRNNSARLVSKLTAPKTKQFYETSFKNAKLSAKLLASCQCVLRFFRSICLKYCACHAKMRPGCTKRCTCQNHLSKPEDPMLQNATSLMKSAPWPPNISDEHVSCTACHAKCIFADPLRMSHACHRFWKCDKIFTFCSLLAGCRIPCACHTRPHPNFKKCSKNGVLCTFWLRSVLRTTTACTFSTCQLPKVVWEWCVFYILTWTCASHHNGVHLLNISTSKSALNPSVFNAFDFQMCFAPQRRALFRHLHIHKRSEAEVFCTFWLPNVLRATTVCTLLISQLPKVLSERGVFCTFWLGNVLRATTACNFSSLIWPDCSAPAALASLLFDPPEPQLIGKTQCFATFLPFRASGSSFFWCFLFCDLLSSSLLFSSLTLPISAFPSESVYIVGSLNSKLPSIIIMHIACCFILIQILWLAAEPIDACDDNDEHLIHSKVFMYIGLLHSRLSRCSLSHLAHTSGKKVQFLFLKSICCQHGGNSYTYKTTYPHSRFFCSCLLRCKL